MEDLTRKSEQELRELGTAEAFDEIIRRLTMLRAQVKVQRELWLRKALPIAIATALRQAHAYHCSILTGRCGVACHPQ